MMKLVLVFALLCVTSYALPRVIMEPDTKIYAPQGWIKSHRMQAEDTIRVHIPLTHSEENKKALETWFWAVSDPQHQFYGQHLSNAQIAELMQVPQTNIDVVTAWLAFHGVVDIRVNKHKDMIVAAGRAADFEKLLDIELHSFYHKSTGVRVARANRHYTVPTGIADLIDFVDGLIRFPPVQDGVHIAGDQVDGSWPSKCGSGCSGQITPWVLSERYNIPLANSSSVPNSKSSVAVAEFQGQYYDNNDLTKFASSCGLAHPVTVDKTIGGNSAGTCNWFGCTESLLDIEYIAAIAQPIPLTDIYLNSYSLLDWIDQVNQMDDAPWVHSVSYGNDERQQTSTDYMFRVNTEFQKAGVRGLSVFFASGDQGVWGRSGYGSKFNPDFPAASPYVTAVGGTHFASDNIGEEECTNWSGGGFSDTFARPSYQSDAVSAYLSEAKLPPSSYYNSSGRAYPDLSALCGSKASYCISKGGYFSGVAGTSASCPVVAGIFARLNDLRFEAGKSPLGFVNPFLYQTQASNPNAFNDVVSGTNNENQNYGFTAATNYDPCSGLGTPNFAELSKEVLSL